MLIIEIQDKLLPAMPLSHEDRQCWTLVRVPTHENDPAIVLPNAKEVVTFGRKIGTNDVTCPGKNVSRKHLKLVRWVENMRQELAFSVKLLLTLLVFTYSLVDNLDFLNHLFWEGELDEEREKISQLLS